MNPPLTDQRFRTEVQFIQGKLPISKFLVHGRISYHEAPEFRALLLGEISRTTASALVVELGGVEHIDTAGLAVLVEGLLAGRERGLRILLCQPSESVLQIFRLAGFHDALDTCCTNPEEVQQRLMA